MLDCWRERQERTQLVAEEVNSGQSDIYTGSWKEASGENRSENPRGLNTSTSLPLSHVKLLTPVSVKSTCNINIYSLE